MVLLAQEVLMCVWRCDICVLVQVVVGNPPTHIMEDAALATPFGVVMAGKETARFPPALNEYEVKLAYSMGEWTAQVAKLLHDSEVS